MTKCTHECSIITAGSHRCFFLYIHVYMFAGCPKSKKTKESFCILNKIYIYIQTNVNNVYSTVLHSAPQECEEQIK